MGAYDSLGKSKMPEDLKTALADEPKARRFYDALSGANKYAILWRLQTAAREETRQKRLQKVITMLLQGKKFHEDR